MIEFVIKYWMEVVFAGGLAIIGAMYRKFLQKLKEQELMKEGILAILHDRLYQGCRYWLKQGHTDIESMKNVEYLYKSYHDLGGNGTGTELYERVKKLPIKED